MPAPNTPMDTRQWLRHTEQRLRIVERHNHAPITADPVAMFLQRAQFAIMGGGTRTVISTGVHWSSRFRILGLGRHPDTAPNGILEIQVPVNGTVIPVHGNSGVLSRTVGTGTTSTYVPLSGNESLWYDLPVKGSANFGSTGSDNLGWHIVSDVDEDVVIPPTWLMVITRNSFAGSNMYLWGDMRSQTP